MTGVKKCDAGSVPINCGHGSFSSSSLPPCSLAGERERWALGGKKERWKGEREGRRERGRKGKREGEGGREGEREWKRRYCVKEDIAIIPGHSFSYVFTCNSMKGLSRISELCFTRGVLSWFRYLAVI